jgi:hypothetical protein
VPGGQKEPAGQSEAAAPGTQKKPAGHAFEFAVVLPAVAQKPAAHAPEHVPDCWPVAEPKKPGGQGVGASEPAGQ